MHHQHAIVPVFLWMLIKSIGSSHSKRLSFFGSCSSSRIGKSKRHFHFTNPFFSTALRLYPDLFWNGGFKIAEINLFKFKLKPLNQSIQSIQIDQLFLNPRARRTLINRWRTSSTHLVAQPTNSPKTRILPRATGLLPRMFFRYIENLNFSQPRLGCFVLF